MDFAAGCMESGSISTLEDLGPEEAFERVRNALDASTVFPAMVDGNRYEPDLTEIARRSGVPEELLRKSGTSINRFVSERFRKAPLARQSAPRFGVCARSEPSDSQTLSERLAAYFASLCEQGQKLPSRPHRPNQADFERISESARVPLEWLKSTGPNGGYAQLTKARRTIGLAEWKAIGPNELLSAATYQSLIDFGLKQRAIEVAGTQTAKTAVAVSRSHLDRFMREQSRNPDSKLGSDFGIELDGHVERIAGSIANDDYRRRFKTEMTRWAIYAHKLREVLALPRDGIDAIGHLMAANSLDAVTLARLAGCANPTLIGSSINRWLRREAMPIVRNVPDIHRIEDVFELPKGALVGSITFHNRLAQRIDHDLFPEWLSDRDRASILRYLPEGFAAMDDEEREETVKELVDKSKHTDIEYRKRLRILQGLPYRFLGPLPQRAAEELRELVRFKTAPDAPHGMRRTPDRRDDGTWGEDSVREAEAFLRVLIAVLAMPRSEGGLALDPEDFTIALVAVPGVVCRVRDWLRARHKEGTGSLTILLSRAVALINPDTGWVKHLPHLAERLPLIEGFVTESMKGEARKDWPAFCEKSRVDLQTHLTALLRDGSRGRHPFAPIRAILALPQPMAVMLELAERLRADIPPKALQPWSYAVGMRDLAIVEVLNETALRRKNLVQLRYCRTEDLHRWADEDPNLSIIYFDEARGCYRVKIYYKRFKNWRSKFFGPPHNKHNYEFDLDPALNGMLTEYFEHARPLLLKGKNYDWAFPCAPGKGGRGPLSREGVSAMFNELTIRYIAYNHITGTGMRGVEPFSIHCVRHIKATHVLKETRDYKDAGAAIQDTAEMAELHYADYGPKDREQRLQESNRSLRRAVQGGFASTPLAQRRLGGNNPH
jgi:hypothetical protein